MRTWSLLVVSTLILCGCDRSPPEPPPDSWSGPGPKHVALIVIDTLRADHLGPYGYARPTSPTLDLLASRSLVFEQAFSTAPSTLESVTSLFTGTAAMQHHKTLPKVVPLQQLFRKAGFRTHAVVSNPWLASRPALFRAGFDEYWFRGSWGANSTREVATAARAQVDAAAQSKGRSFFYFHFLDPHDPYASPEEQGFYKGPSLKRRIDVHHASGENEVKRRYRAEGFRGLPTPMALSDAELDFIRAAYDEEIRFTDKHVAGVLEALERHRMLPDTLVIVTSDHGEAFMEHGLLKHGFHMFDELIHVPLLIFWPKGIEAGRRGDLVSGIDVPSTLLAAVGIDAPPQFRGYDLRTRARAGQPLPLRTHFANQEQVGFRSSRYKWIHDRISGRTEVYDLQVDPAEKKPLVDPTVIAEQQEVWERVRARHAFDGAERHEPAPTLSDETRKQLEELGYMVE